MMPFQRIIPVIVALMLGLSGCGRQAATTESSQSALATISPTPSPTPRTLPSQSGAVNDYANVLSAPEEKRLESLATKLLRESDAEVAIATIETTFGEPLFDYSLALAREWKVSSKSGRGLLLVLAIKD